MKFGAFDRIHSVISLKAQRLITANLILIVQDVNSSRYGSVHFKHYQSSGVTLLFLTRGASVNFVHFWGMIWFYSFQDIGVLSLLLTARCLEVLQWNVHFWDYLVLFILSHYQLSSICSFSRNLTSHCAFTRCHCFTSQAVSRHYLSKNYHLSSSFTFFLYRLLFVHRLFLWCCNDIVSNFAFVYFSSN